MAFYGGKWEINDIQVEKGFLLILTHKQGLHNDIYNFWSKGTTNKVSTMI